MNKVKVNDLSWSVIIIILCCCIFANTITDMMKAKFSGEVIYKIVIYSHGNKIGLRRL